MSEENKIQKLKTAIHFDYIVGENCDEINDKSMEFEDGIFCAYEVKKEGKQIAWIENIGVILEY